jgi:hypothetical protein
MMLSIIAFRFPGLPTAIHTAWQALLWAVALLVALALVVAVLLAVSPYLPQLMVGASVIMAYAMATMPQPRKAAQP